MYHSGITKCCWSSFTYNVFKDICTNVVRIRHVSIAAICIEGNRSITWITKWCGQYDKGITIWVKIIGQHLASNHGIYESDVIIIHGNGGIITFWQYQYVEGPLCT